MRKLAWSACLALLAVHSSPVRAHFKLLAPDSWVNEASDGAPQKGAPCGPGGSDDGGSLSMKVTTVHAGDMLAVEIEETIHHSGWFRIALSADRAAFTTPEFPNADCTVDMSTVPTGAHDNVLADGLAMDTEAFGSNRMIKEMVKIPDEPCDKCTLQVIQVMADTIHSPPGCIYYHCADLQILPAEGGGAAGAAPSAGTSGSAAGATSTAGTTGDAGSAAPSGAAGAATSGSGAATGRAGAAGMSRPPSSAPSTGSAGKPSTGSASSANTGTPAPSGAGAAGSVAGNPPPAMPPADGGGCAVTRVGSDSRSLSFAFCLGLAVASIARARKRRARA